jgi:hypothetical protein
MNILHNYYTCHIIKLYKFHVHKFETNESEHKGTDVFLKII